MMFGLIKKLREKDEEIEELRAEHMRTLNREAATIEAYYGAKKLMDKAIAEAAEWKDKYCVLQEKYLNLLERYEKALKGVE